MLSFLSLLSKIFFIRLTFFSAIEKLIHMYYFRYNLLYIYITYTILHICYIFFVLRYNYYIFRLQESLSEVKSLSSYLMLFDVKDYDYYICKRFNITSPKVLTILRCYICMYPLTPTPWIFLANIILKKKQSAVQDMLIQSKYTSSWENDTDMLIVSWYNM